MGLLDILNGMQNGPRGQRAPAGPNSGGGMSPITMAVLGLLAYKALKHVTGNQQPASPGNTADAAPAGGGLGGGLGDLLSGKSGGLGGLGGLLAGGAAGSVLSGGLNDLLNQFQQKGQGDVASSWVGSGPNKEISPNDLSKVLGEDQIQTLMAQTGVSRDELFEGLSEQLPSLIDRLTPQGGLPTEQEVSRLV